MYRHFYTAGCWALVATGAAHLFGHYGMVTSEGQNETDRQLLSLMRGHVQDMGLGFVRSTFDILAGLSLTFAVLSLGLGLIGLLVRRHADTSPGLLRQTAIAYAGTYGIMSAVAFRYWFPAPLFFVLLTFACFTLALATAPREG